jgi:hypothetical protein
VNCIGTTAVVLSVVGFAITHKRLRHRSFPIRIRFFFVFALLSVPSISFAVCLARYVRSCGLSAHFVFHSTFSPEAGQPALVGVRIGRAGHFIAVLEVRDGQVTVADPLSGETQMTLAKFQHSYDFTGFHMVVQRI